MTQKELLYLEDAVGHEESIIKICQDAVKTATDEVIITFALILFIVYQP